MCNDCYGACQLYLAICCPEVNSLMESLDKMVQAHERPVVVAGLGPSGAVLALILARADIPVLILEKGSAVATDLRASTFHPPTLDMLAAIDESLMSEMLKMGLKADRYQYRDRVSDETATFDLSLLTGETQFPFRLQLEQYELTRLIQKLLEKNNSARILFGHELVGYEECDDHVQIYVRTGERNIELAGSFLIGCDGARSRVRKEAGIVFEGFTYEEKFLVIGTDFPFEEVFADFSYVNYVSDPEEWCVILRTEKTWRVLFPTPSIGEIDEAFFLSDQFVQERLQHLHKIEGAYNVRYKSLYTVNQRVAQRFYDGRIVLVGDACHINNPLGGMGMNGGIHDAYDLALRLIRVIRGEADFMTEFEKYDLVRRSLASRFVQEHTIANKAVMESTDPDIQKSRQAHLMQTAADPVLAKEFMMERSMINSVRETMGKV